jgi:hypothetical protein
MTEFIAHSRTKGSKNGRRRYQNENGTWTNEGKERRREEYARQRRAALPGEVSAEYSNRGRGTTSGETFEFKKNREGKYTYAGPKSRHANIGDIDQIARNADKIPGSAKDISEGISRIKGKRKERIFLSTQTKNSEGRSIVLISNDSTISLLLTINQEEKKS